VFVVEAASKERQNDEDGAEDDAQTADRIQQLMKVVRTESLEDEDNDARDDQTDALVTPTVAETSFAVSTSAAASASTSVTASVFLGSCGESTSHLRRFDEWSRFDADRRRRRRDEGVGNAVGFGKEAS